MMSQVHDDTNSFHSAVPMLTDNEDPEYYAMHEKVNLEMDHDRSSFPPPPVRVHDNYDWDMVLVFPRTDGNEMKKENRYNLNSFLKCMLGLRRRGGLSHENKDELIQDQLRLVLRSPRCFLDDDGKEIEELESAEDLNENEYLNKCRHILHKEYVRYIGHADKTTEGQFCDLIATR